MPTSSIGYWSSVLAHQYFARLQEKLAALDIGNWYYVLLVIEDGAGRLSQQELADRLLLDKVSMTRALDHLGTKGLVERCACSEDRRKHLIKLTSKAAPAVKAVRQAYAELNRTATKGLEKGAQDVFLEQLHHMLQNLSAADRPVTVTNKRVTS